MFCVSTAPATKKWVRGIRSPITATQNDVNIADPNSMTISQNEHFELSKTNLQKHQILRLPRKTPFFFTTSNFEQLLRRFCTPLKILTFCTFPDFRKSTRRAGENAPPSSRAGKMQIFDLEGNFSPEGLPKKPNTSAHTTDLHQRLFSFRKNPIVRPHCLGNMS